MTEWKCFDDDVATVSTFAFHEHRPRAPHWEQAAHRGRMQLALDYAIRARGDFYVDLGCGDGGMLQQLRAVKLAAYGYDFQPSNVDGWAERGVGAMQLDFVNHWEQVAMADVYMITEVLEHLTDPHEAVRRIRDRGAQIICSSPFTETYDSHDECHAWAWDLRGYAQMILSAGFDVVEHQTVQQFQVLRGEPR